MCNSMNKMNTKQFLVGLVMIMMVGAAMGQNDCYNPTMRAAKAAYDKGNYQRAEQLYREASECYDCTAQQKAQAKRKAEESRKKRVAATTTGSTTNSHQQREEELRRREERLRQREAALRREEEQAAERKRQEEARQAEERRKREESERNRKRDNITLNVSGVEFKMVWVEGGTFTMGCTSEQGGDCSSDEYPAHSMTVSSYYMCETEVTQALWQAVMGNNPSHWKGDNLPVENVSWEDAQEFIEKLNRLTGRTFRLPTEAEWEYAARGGNKSRGYKYSGSNSIDAVAWYKDNSGEKTHPVKRKQANELGLYDMSGNVKERCSDGYDDYYGSESQNDSGGSSTGSILVVRGGGWYNDASSCRVSYRSGSMPNAISNSGGFRLVLCP